MIEDKIRLMEQSRLELAKRLNFFDGGIWLGQPEGFPVAVPLIRNHLDEVLEKRLITGGLLSHWRGKTVSAQEGNEALSQALKAKSENLFAVWTGLPLFPAESGLLPESAGVKEKVRGVRIFPRSHNFVLEAWCIGSLCEWLVGRRMPLFIWHTELDWACLYALAKAFPALRIVVETQVQKILYQTRPLFALMRDCPNLFLELSNLVGSGFIEYAVRQFRASRLIFASFIPVNDPLVPMGMILDAKISEQEKFLIAGENLRWFINEVRL